VREVLPLLAGLDLGLVREMALVNCPLPEASFKDVIVALGATGVKVPLTSMVSMVSFGIPKLLLENHNS
jgi:hypothetical protein